MNELRQGRSHIVSFLFLAENQTRSVQVTPVFCFVYAFTCMTSVLGNSVIIHIIRKDNTMKNTTNYLIMSQACSDLYLTMICMMNVFIPLTDFTKFTHLWIGGLVGQITCKSLLASVVISPVFSGWILVPIAVERFYAVTTPFKSSPISQHFKKTILLVYTWSVASSINIIVNAVVVEINKYHYCGLPSGMTYIDISLAALNVSIILLIITVLYTIVCLKLWSREVPGEGTNQNQGQLDANKKTAKKVTRMMIVVVVLYVMCWFPTSILLVLNYFGYAYVSSNVYFFVIWLTLAFSGTNPYIYLGFNQKFRQAFNKMFGNCCRKCKIDNIPQCYHFRSQSIDLEQM